MKERDPVKHCIMCAKDRQNEEVSMVQVLPATWNGFNNFAEVCGECQGSRRFLVWAKSIKPSARAAAAASASAAAPSTAVKDASAAESVQVTHRRTGALLHTVAGATLA